MSWLVAIPVAVVLVFNLNYYLTTLHSSKTYILFISCFQSVIKKLISSYLTYEHIEGKLTALLLQRQNASSITHAKFVAADALSKTNHSISKIQTSMKTLEFREHFLFNFSHYFDYHSLLWLTSFPSILPSYYLRSNDKSADFATSIWVSLPFKTN